MRAPDIDAWIEDVKAQPGSDSVGMMLVHRGVVRGTTRSGEPVSGMMLEVDRAGLTRALEAANTWTGVFSARAWVNEGELVVGDDIMSVLIAGDIRPNVFDALQRLVGVIKTEVVSEYERP